MAALRGMTGPGEGGFFVLTGASGSTKVADLTIALHLIVCFITICSLLPLDVKGRLRGPRRVSSNVMAFCDLHLDVTNALSEIHTLKPKSPSPSGITRLIGSSHLTPLPTCPSFHVLSRPTQPLFLHVEQPNLHHFYSLYPLHFVCPFTFALEHLNVRLYMSSQSLSPLKCDTFPRPSQAPTRPIIANLLVHC